MRIREGDPLEIYTSRDGEVIFKKYSLMGGLDEFAAQFCETLSKSTGFPAAVTDRDTVIAVAGGGPRIGATTQAMQLLHGIARHQHLAVLLEERQGGAGRLLQRAVLGEHVADPVEIPCLQV